MVGRKRKPCTPLYSDLLIELPERGDIHLENIPIKCPICKSEHVRSNGTQKRGNTRVTSYRCDNRRCPFRFHSAGGKQFTIYSSLFVFDILQSYLEIILANLFHSQGKLVDIARYHHISPSLLSYLYNKLQDAMGRQIGLQNLVDERQKDQAIAIDETFLKINGKTYYIIMATGYASHKILGLKVSQTRKMGDMLHVFNEADANTSKPISIITADAWNGTQALAKYLDRPITIIIHKHKKPYERVIVRRYDYDANSRFTTTIGIKSDFCMRRKVREFYFMESCEKRYAPPKKKLGRPKGVKNGQGKKRPYVKKNVQKGRKGLFTVFDKGRRGYAKVDPHRKTVRVGRNVSNVVAATLGKVVKLFSKSFIQNNLAEHKNSVLSNYLVLSGPKTAESIEKRLRTFIICQNNPRLLHRLQIRHQFQQEFLIRQIQNSPLRWLLIGGNYER